MLKFFYSIPKIGMPTWNYRISAGFLMATLLLFFLHVSELFAQSNEERIRAVREASNTALKALDEEANFKFLTDDVLITTGNGTLLSGKDELKAYIKSASNTQPMYWIRTPDEIMVNEERGLAWETGVWHAYSASDPNEDNPVSRGKYAAQWILSGEWKIQSQIFVMLN